MQNNILTELDKYQKEVVKHRHGPLLVVAGPGSGKTLALTRRIAYLIVKKWARPEEILGLTFTDAAACEMRDRVDELVPYGYVQTWIGTFHSFCQHIITEFGSRIGFDPDSRVVTHPELYVMLSENIFSFGLKQFLPVSNPERFISILIGHISRLRDEDISPEEYLTYAEKTEDEKLVEIAQFYHKYDSFLKSRGVIDISGLITNALTILRKEPSALVELQKRYKYILVDEFQDTNFSQYQLLKLLTAKHSNICVVGDDDQSIFKFRGAAITNILSFKDDYPEAKVVVLKNNYRSLPLLTEVAYRLIRHNDPNRLETKIEIDKKIESVRKGKGKIEHYFYETIDQEADNLAERVIKEHKKGISYNDMAILVRNNRDADPIIRAFNMSNVLWRFSGNQGLFDRSEIRMLLSFLHTIADPEDSVHLYHLLSSDLYQPKGRALNSASALARKKNKPLIEVITDQDFQSTVDGESKAVFNKVVDDIDHYSDLSLKKETGAVLYSFLKEKGIFSQLMEQGIEGEVKIKNISRFFEMLRRLGRILEVDRVPIMTQKLELLRKGGENPPVAEADIDIDAINILTVHRAKGKEFQTVFIGGLYQGNFPANYAYRRRGKLTVPQELLKETIPSGDYLQEERRLFYVALTRAKNKVVLTGARDVGTKRPREPSQFIAEVLDMHKNEIEVLKRGRVRDIEISDEGAKYLSKLPAAMSARQIDDYLTCPLKYKFIHILRIPIVQHHTVVFGMAIHAAIAYLLRAKLEEKKPSLDRMIRVFRNNWQAEGFLSRQHEELSFQRGIRVITEFYNREINEPPPSLVEQNFSFQFEDIRIIGRWDRVDLNQGGSVIDYKTSEKVDQKKANREARESIQLAIYAMAFRETYGHIPKHVELRFVEKGIVGQMKKVEDKLKKKTDSIINVIEGISKRDFAPNPRFGACSYCLFRDLCPYEKKR